MSLLSDLPPDMADYVLEKILEEKIVVRNNEPLKLFKVKYKSCDSVLDYTWENEKDLIQDPMFPTLLQDFKLNLHRKRKVADRDESSEDDVALAKLTKRKRSMSDLDTSSPSNQSHNTNTVKAEMPELISQQMEVFSDSDDETLLQKRLRSLTNQTSNDSLPNQERNQRQHSNVKLEVKALVSNGRNDYKLASKKSSTEENNGSPHTIPPLPLVPPLPPPKTPTLKTSNQSRMEAVETTPPSELMSFVMKSSHLDKQQHVQNHLSTSPSPELQFAATSPLRSPVLGFPSMMESIVPVNMDPRRLNVPLCWYGFVAVFKHKYPLQLVSANPTQVMLLNGLAAQDIVIEKSMPLQTAFIFMQRFQRCLVNKLKISASIQIQRLCQFVSMHYRRILVATLSENQLLFFLPPMTEFYDLLSLPKEFHPPFYVIIFNMESLSSPPPQVPKITINDSLIVPDTLGQKVNKSDIHSLTNQLLSHCFDAVVVESLFKSETCYDIIGSIKSLEVNIMDTLLKSLGGVRDPENAKVILIHNQAPALPRAKNMCRYFQFGTSLSHHTNRIEEILPPKTAIITLGYNAIFLLREVADWVRKMQYKFPMATSSKGFKNFCVVVHPDVVEKLRAALKLCKNTTARAQAEVLIMDYVRLKSDDEILEFGEENFPDLQFLKNGYPGVAPEHLRICFSLQKYFVLRQKHYRHAIYIDDEFGAADKLAEDCGLGVTFVKTDNWLQRLQTLVEETN